MTRVDLQDDAWLAVLVLVDMALVDDEDDHQAALLGHAAGEIRKAVGL